MPPEDTIAPSAAGRQLKYCHAIREALDICLQADPTVYVMGLGVPDPKGVFDSTSGLQDRHGPARVLDMPASENGIAGMAIGSAVAGMRPVIVHQRMDFAILCFDQLVNQAAKWHYMFGGKAKVPLVMRMIVGRGWGQGSQHAQSLQSWLAHVPGLKVIMPATPHDAKGMMIAAIEDDNPVVSIEHRWLFNIDGPVPEGHYTTEIGRARIIRPGRDVTVAAVSHMTIEAVRAAEFLAAEGIDAEVIDLRTLRPLDREALVDSVSRTGRLVVADTGWKTFGASAEIIATVTERAFSALKSPPQRIALADISSPSTPALAEFFFPGVKEIVAACRTVLGRPILGVREWPGTGLPHDVPDNAFRGPF
jgi:pyruvate/2-oxoglutarate/acetoin dehydrogenase E1 component